MGCTHMDFKIWKVLSGTVLNKIIVIDSLGEAQKFSEETFFKGRDAEKDMFDAAKKLRNEEEETARADKDDKCCKVDSPTKWLTEYL